MSERVVEILVFIMREIRRDSNISKKLNVLSEDLVQQGYTDSEISSALTWLHDRMHGESEELIASQEPALKYSVRHLHEIEKAVISTDAFGYLIQLKELGIIGHSDFEQVIERALMLGTGNVTIFDIKSIVASMLFNSNRFSDGSHFFLNDNLTIQ